MLDGTTHRRRLFGRRTPTPLEDGWTPLSVRTLDGVTISGVELPASRDTDSAVVLCHGFLGSWRRPQNVDLARSLATHHAVYLFDFRGHGSSGGHSTVGDREALDVHAVIGLARERGHRRVTTVGASMGGVSVLREAATFGDVDAIVSISAPARWAGHGRIARTAGVLVSTRVGRAFARRALNTHVYHEWTWASPPIETIDAIEAPILIVHGSDDRFIPKAQAELLYNRARPPKRLLVLDGFGHAELGYDAAFAKRMLVEIAGMLEGRDWGAQVGPT